MSISVYSCSEIAFSCRPLCKIIGLHQWRGVRRQGTLAAVFELCIWVYDCAERLATSNERELSKMVSYQSDRGMKLLAGLV